MLSVVPELIAVERIYFGAVELVISLGDDNCCVRIRISGASTAAARIHSWMLLGGEEGRKGRGKSATLIIIIN